MASLLRDVELRSGAGFKPLLDEIENPAGRLDVALIDPQPILGREHLEIGIADRRHGRKHDHLLVETAGNGSFLCRTRESPVLAPEIDLVAGVERGMEQVPLGYARARVPEALGKTREVDLGQ